MRNRGRDGRRARTGRGHDGRAGFGLIEAIVALAIAGMVLAAVTELAGRALRSWNRGFDTVAAIERTDVALGRIAADLTALLPVHLATSNDPAVLFAGDERGMAFTAVTPFDARSEGIAVVEIAVEATRDGAVLVRRLRRGRDAGLRDGDRVVLLSGRLGLAFAYRDQTGRRVAQWTRPGEVPQGVIVTLRGDRGGGGLPVEVFLPIPVAISVSCLVQVPDEVSAEGGGPAPTKAAAEDSAATGAPGVDVRSEADRAPDEDRRRRCATGPGNETSSAAAPASDPTSTEVR